MKRKAHRQTFARKDMEAADEILWPGMAGATPCHGQSDRFVSTRDDKAGDISQKRSKTKKSGEKE